MSCAASVIERPWDREAWAVFADQLTDLGDPRGEVIALDLQLERLDASDRRRREWLEWQEQLVSEHGRPWVRALRSLAETCGCPMTGRRTFPGSMTLSKNEWGRLERARQVAPISELGLCDYQAVPFTPPRDLFERLEVLCFTEGLPPRRQLAALSVPHLRALQVYGLEGRFEYPFEAHLEALELNSPLAPSLLARLPDDDRLARLKSLGIEPAPSGWFGKKAASLWSALGRLPLEQLELRVHGLDDAVGALAASPLRERLGELFLYAGRESARGLPSVFTAPWPRLRKLHCGLEDVERAPVFAAARGLENLQELSVADVDEALGMALARAPFPHLEVLTLASADLQGVRQVLASPWLGSLRTMDLSTNRLGPDLGSALASAADRLESLEHLDLRMTDLGEQGVDALLGAEFASLAVLKMDLDRGASRRLVRRLPHAAWRLRELEMHGADELDTLCRSPAFERLRRLSILDAGVVDRSLVMALLDLDSLVRLDLEGVTQLAPDLRALLERRFGDCIS